VLIGAALGPHPPILVPAVTGGQRAGSAGARELDRLRAACDEAVAGLLRLRPDVLVIVGGAEHSGQPPLSAPGCLSQFGVWSGPADPATRAALGGDVGPNGPVLPLSLTIGRWLVHRAGAVPAPGELRLHAVAESAPAAECLTAGARLAALAPRVALLVMGDGPARRARGVPGAPDPETDQYDAGLAAAFGGADAKALAALDPDHSAALIVSGRAPWQVLAGAAADGRFRGQVTYAGAPFEVSYLAGTWHRDL
jgi:hypothetical protein